MNTPGRTITRQPGAGGAWTITGDFYVGAGAVSWGTSTTAVTVSQDMTIKSGGTVSLSTSVSSGGNLLVGRHIIVDGIYVHNGKSLTCTGTGVRIFASNQNSNNYGSCTINSGAICTLDGTDDDFDCTSLAALGTLDAATNNKAISASNVTTIGSGGVGTLQTGAGLLDVNGTLSTSGPSMISIGTGGASVAGAVIISANGLFSNSGLLTFDGTTGNFSSSVNSNNYGNVAVATGRTVTLAGSDDDFDLASLSVDGSLNAATNNMAISASTTTSTGTMTTGTGKLTVTGLVVQTAGTVTLGAGGADFGGNVTVSGGTFSNAGMLTFNGSTPQVFSNNVDANNYGNVTIEAGADVEWESLDDATRFRVLTLRWKGLSNLKTNNRETVVAGPADAIGTLTTGTRPLIVGSLTQTAGIISIGSGGITVTAGDLSVSGSSFTNSGTLTFGGMSPQTLTSNLDGASYGTTVIAVGSGVTLAGADGTIDFVGLGIDGSLNAATNNKAVSATSLTSSGTLTTGTGKLVVSGTVSQTDGSITIGTGGVDIDADLVVAGTFSNSGLVTFTGTGSWSDNSVAGQDFGIVEVVTPASVSLLTDIRATRVTVAASATLSLDTRALTLAGSGTPFVVAGGATFVAGTGLVRYASTTGATVSSLSYSDLDIAGTGTFSADGPLTCLRNLYVTSGTLSTGGVSLTVSGSLFIAGDLFAPLSTIEVGENMAESGGTFSNAGGRVRLVGGDQALQGSFTFHHLEKVVSTAATLTFYPSSFTVVNGDLTLRGAAGQLLRLRTVAPGVPSNLTDAPGGTTSVSFVDVRDNDASSGQTINASNSVDAGNNINWNFGGGAGVSISGTLFDSDGSTPLGNKGVKLFVAGGLSLTTSSAVGTGQFSFTNVDLSPGDAIVVFLDNDPSKGMTASKIGNDPPVLTSFDIVVNSLRVRHDGGATSITNSDLATIDDGAVADPDVLFSVDAFDNLTVNSNLHLVLLPGEKFIPGADVEVSALRGGGTFTSGSNDLTLTGSGSNVFDVADWTDPNGGTVTYTGTVVTLRTDRFFNLVVDGPGPFTLSGTTTVDGDLTVSSGTFVTGSSTLDVDGSLTLTTGTFSAGSGTIKVAQNFDASGSSTFSAGTSTFEFDGNSSATVALPPGQSFFNLTINKTGAVVTMGSPLKVDNVFTVTNGTFRPQYTLTLDGNLVNNGTISALSPSTVVFLGASRTLSGTGITGFDNLTVGSPGTPSSLVVDADMTADIINIVETGTDFVDNGGLTLTGSGNPITIEPGGSFTVSPTSTVRYAPTTPGVVFVASGFSYGNLTFDGAGSVFRPGPLLQIDGSLLLDAGTLDLSFSNGDVVVRGDLTITAGATFTKGSGLLRFDGTTQTYTDNTASKQDLGTVEVGAAGASTAVTLTSDIRLTDVTITSTGTLDGTGRTITVHKDWTNAGSFSGTTGTVRFIADPSATINTGGDGMGKRFHNLTIDKTNTTDVVVVTGSPIRVDGSLLVVRGTLSVERTATFSSMVTVQPTGVLDLSATTIPRTLTLGGNVTVSTGATFRARASVASPLTLTFAAGSTTVVQSGATIDVDGTDPASRIILRSSTPGVRWNLNLSPSATATFSFVDVKDSDASSGNTASAINSMDSGNNLNWAFGSSSFMISGVLEDGNANPIPGKTVRLLVGGLDRGTTLTAAGTGVYTFSAVSVTIGDRICVYVDNDPVVRASAVSKVSTTLTNLDNVTLSQGRQRLIRFEIPERDLNTSDVLVAIGLMPVDPDIGLTVTGGTQLSVADDLDIVAPTAFSPDGGVVVAGTFRLSGRIDKTDKDLSVKGLRISSGGEFLTTTGLLRFTGTGEMCDDNNNDLGHVRVESGAAVTLCTSVRIRTLEVQSSSLLDLSTRTLTLTETGTPLTVTGNLVATAGRVRYTGSPTVVVRGALTYGDLDLDRAGTTFTLDGDLTVERVLTVAAGTLDIGTRTLELRGSGLSFVFSEPVDFSAGRVRYTGSPTVVVRGDLTYGDLELDRAGTTFTLDGDLTVERVLSVPAGTFDLGTRTLDLRGNGSPFVQTGGVVVLLDGRVRYTGSPTVVVRGSLIYGDLELDRAGTTFTVDGDLTVDRDLTVAAGTLSLGTASLTVGRSCFVLVPGSVLQTTGLLTFPGLGTGPWEFVTEGTSTPSSFGAVIVGTGSPMVLSVRGSLSVSSFRVLPGAIVTHPLSYLPGLDITSGGFIRIDAGASIDVSGRGYRGGFRDGNSSGNGETFPGSTPASGRGGGGYGGFGAATNLGAGGGGYGSGSAPAELGSGGGGDNNSDPGGNGGGRVRLVAQGELRIDGTLFADGGYASAGTRSGGGGGGSVYLVSGLLTGGGTIRANGGECTGAGQAGGGGGGGRVALLYGSLSGFDPLTQIESSGGRNTNLLADPSFHGGAGTIYLLRTSIPLLTQIRVVNGGIPGAATPMTEPLDCSDFICSSSALVTSLYGGVVTGNFTLETGGRFEGGASTSTLTVDGSLIIGGGGVFRPASSLLVTTSLRHVLILSGGTIDATSGVIRVQGDWTLNPGGTFVAGTGTVVFHGSVNQLLNGSTMFRDLHIMTEVPRTVTFQASSTTTVNGDLILVGRPAGRLSLVSGIVGAVSNLVHTGSGQTVYDVSVRDNNAAGGNVIFAINSVNDGNTPNWQFKVLPRIDNFSPKAAPAGTSITITGVNLDAVQKVDFGGVRVDNNLPPEVVVATPARARYAPPSVTADGLHASARLPFTLTFDGSPLNSTSFAPRLNVTTTPALREIATSDLDGDGLLDLVVTSPSSVGLYRSQALITVDPTAFDPVVELLGPTGSSIAVGDVTGDGLPDICVGGNGVVFVFRNMSTPGSLSFAPRVDVTGFTGDVSLAIGDFDGDGRVDLVTGASGEPTVSIHLNITRTNSPIYFRPLSVSLGEAARHITTGDVTGDGILDIVVARSTGVTVLQNLSRVASLSFAQLEVSLPSSVERSATGDFDRDGALDLATVHPTENAIRLLRNDNGAGGLSFTSFGPFATGIDPRSLALADLNGDALTDIVVLNRGSSGTVTTFGNTTTAPGPLSVVSSGSFVVGNDPPSVVIGDLTGDGRPEIVATSLGENVFAVLKNVVPPAVSSAQRAFVIPHFLEQSGRTTNTPFTFDTQFFFTYSGGLGGSPATGGADVDVFFYDDAGQPLRGVTNEVCNPCTYALNATTRTIDFYVEDLIVNNGGGFDVSRKTGSAVLVVDGDFDNVAVRALVQNSHASSSDVSLWNIGPQPVIICPGDDPCVGNRTFVIPHVLEQSGSTLTTPFTFDTEVFAVYTGGLAGITGTGGATVELYLFDQTTGLPMQGGSGSVCNPCTFGVNSSQRKQSIRVEDLIQAAGGYGGSNARLGYGVLVVGGADADKVAVQGFIVNSHSSSFDLSVFGFEPTPITATPLANSAVSPGTYVIPHILERSGTVSTTPHTFDTELHMMYTAGLGGTPSGGGAGVSFYLYDSTGQAMQGSSGPVCNPCMYSLTDANRKQTIRIDDLIVANGGGFDTPVKQGYGVIVLAGDEDYVVLQQIITNSHNAPNDVAMYEFKPQLAVEGPPIDGNTQRVLNWTAVRSAVQDFERNTENVGSGHGLVNGATMNLYMYDQNGAPTQALGGQAVCNPCTFPLSATAPRQVMDFDQLIRDAGGYDVPQKSGLAVVLTGGEANKVHLVSTDLLRSGSPPDVFAIGSEPAQIDAAVGPYPPIILTSPLAMSFASLSVGDSMDADISLKNVGGGMLVIVPPYFRPDSDPGFTIASPPGSLSLGQGESTTFSVRFKPAAIGEVFGTVEVESDGGNTEVSLKGTGVTSVPNLFLSLSVDSVFNEDPLKPGKSKKPVKHQKRLYPNWSNLIDEMNAQGGFAPGTSESDSAGAMVVGRSFMSNIGGKWKPVKDSAAIYCWVRLAKWDFKKNIGKSFANIQKTLRDKNIGMHTGLASGLDTTTDGKGKKLVKQLTGLSPKKQNNKLFAELVALKVNIAASALGKTPAGFGDLIFDVDGNPFDEMQVRDISSKADTMMTHWQGHSQELFDSLYSAVHSINNAFIGRLDTLSFDTPDVSHPQGKLVVAGQVDINTRTFLKLPSPFVPTRVVAVNGEVESPEDFEDDVYDDLMPVAAKLYQNYPNPFNPATTLAFRLREESIRDREGLRSARPGDGDASVERAT